MSNVTVRPTIDWFESISNVSAMIVCSSPRDEHEPLVGSQIPLLTAEIEHVFTSAAAGGLLRHEQVDVRILPVPRTVFSVARAADLQNTRFPQRVCGTRCFRGGATLRSMPDPHRMGKLE